MIEVCHIASGDRWAGAEVQLAGLLRALRGIEDLSVHAIFLNEGELAAEARESGVEVCVISEREKNFFQILSAASRFLNGKNIQILHSHRYKENLLAYLLRRWCSVPVHVSSVHGAPEPFTGLRRFKQRIVEQVDRRILRSTTRTISVSDDLRRQLMRYIPEKKVLTIHNGIDPKRVFSSLSTAEAKERLGIPADYWVIGTAGRLVPVKRMDIFLAAAQGIVRVRPSTKILVAGGGSEERRLRELADSLGISSEVLFLGHREDVFDVLRAMDLFVFSSDHEGLPMSLLEALWLGVPVVARSVGGIPEVIHNGLTGVLVNSADPKALGTECLYLLQDNGRRGQMALAGTRLIAERFTLAKNAREVACLYRSLIAPKP